jgi:hypothetical protein
LRFSGDAQKNLILKEALQNLCKHTPNAPINIVIAERILEQPLVESTAQSRQDNLSI